MTGKRDEAGDAGGWSETVQLRLKGLVDETIEALADMAIKSNDLLAVERRARAITNLARSVKAIEALRARPRPKSAVELQGGDDDSDEWDPAEVARIEAELESGLDRIRATVEAARLDGWTVVGEEEGDDGDAACRAAEASDHA